MLWIEECNIHSVKKEVKYENHVENYYMTIHSVRGERLFHRLDRLLTKSVIWGIPTEFWFYDAVAAGIFGIFFLIYAVYSGQKKGGE
jgi:hypothetical protein